MIQYKNESWVEKYRPKKLNEIISQDNITSSIKGIIEKKNMPHLLFFGPSGCGKTSTILALSRELFTDKYFDERVIELNASDERGIKIVREKIKRYAKTSINIKDNIPNFKIIILDEADSMTSESQYALRKIMEDYATVTRFCIICNYYQRIIDPIISRCSLIRFKPIMKDKILFKLTDICNKENISCSKNNLQLIVNKCKGDLRKSINFLQRCNNNDNNINDNIINEMSGIIHIPELQKFIQCCYNKEIKNINKYILNFHNNSYSLTNQINILIDIIKNLEYLSDDYKSKIILKILDIDYNLNNGCDEYIQYYNFAYFIVSLDT
jgi:replication factor C subunit 2/4